MTRDWNSPEYKAWRKAVYARDRYRCRLCGGKGKLQAHHVKRWADHPELRFAVSNGVTLCKACHQKTAGKELQMEATLSQLVLPARSAAQIMVMRYARRPPEQARQAEERGPEPEA
jgi:5-methylcytosine-specific restriction endonuclease McrA